MSIKNEKHPTKRNSVQAIWYERYRYAWENARSDLLNKPLATFMTVMVIAISLALPLTCYLIWKNIHTSSEQWYPTPQLTVYLKKSLSDEASLKLANQLEYTEGIKSMVYISKEQALKEFREWSGFETALNMLDDNPLPAVVMLVPSDDKHTIEQLKALRYQISLVPGVEDVRLDDGWFTRLTALTGLIAVIASILALLMVAAVFLVIGNSIRLNIFTRRDTINVMKLIGATDGFILRPFLANGAMLGFLGAVMALIFAQLLVYGLEATTSIVAKAFNTQFNLQSVSWDETLLLLIVSTMIGWFAARMATTRHLAQFSPH